MTPAQARKLIGTPAEFTFRAGETGTLTITTVDRRTFETACGGKFHLSDVLSFRRKDPA